MKVLHVSSDAPTTSHLDQVLWFLLNALLLLQPVHWFVNDHQAPVAGLPATLVYFIAISVSIAASVVAAYLAEYAGQAEGAGQ